LAAAAGRAALAMHGCRPPASLPPVDTILRVFIGCRLLHRGPLLPRLRLVRNIRLGISGDASG
jgi:hypothetical protein